MRTNKNLILSLIISVLATILSCGGSDGSGPDSAISTARPSTPSTHTQDKSIDVSPKDLSAKGVGPITRFNPRAIEESDVQKGQALFKLKCTMCHKMDAKLVGPPLRGITDRRSPEWVLNMLLAPEKMIAEDPAAKELYAKYKTPMINQQLTEGEAKAIYDYLRKP